MAPPLSGEQLPFQQGNSILSGRDMRGNYEGWRQKTRPDPAFDLTPPSTLSSAQRWPLPRGVDEGQYPHDAAIDLVDKPIAFMHHQFPGA